MDHALTLRGMKSTDLSFADRVRAAVGWNQTREDWQRLLELEPAGCFVAECEGRPAGTLTSTCHGKDLAWIGMVLVHPDFRRKGIGRALLERARQYLQSLPVRCIKLDATPLGKTLYDQLGFKDEWTLARWETAACGAAAPRGSTLSVRSLQPSDWDELRRLDREAFGVSRQRLLEILARQSSRATVLRDAGGRLHGFGMLRKGMRSHYLGPVIARSTDGVAHLVAALTAGCVGQSVYWDIPDANREAITLAQSMGFTRQRPLVRMFLGTNEFPGRPEWQYAIADPATG